MAFSYLTRLGGAVLNRSSAIFLCKILVSSAAFLLTVPRAQAGRAAVILRTTTQTSIWSSAPAFLFGVTSLLRVDLIDSTWELIGCSKGSRGSRVHHLGFCQIWG